MRISKAELETITGGLTQTAAQARWFKQHFGVSVVCDRAGPVITRAAFEALVAKRYGLGAAQLARPEVKVRKAA